MRVAVLQFPGSNCDRDVVRAFGVTLGLDTALWWHEDPELPDGTDLVVLPGGFSYGDYLRCGAIAAHAAAMGAVRRFAASGGTVLGICNGFQILCEARLLPGALVRNVGLDFVCKDVTVRVDGHCNRLTARLPYGSRWTMPVAHMEGNFRVDADELATLEARGQIVLRYVDPAAGERGNGANPNGALSDAAAVCNEAGNVIGMMPHPERATTASLGSEDGRALLAGLVESVTRSK
ncbi:MAG: phosphoribosylformylglycinamidine synthase subunit PurQ [Myxococcales bacterium]|nr:phosphoribosylformylglycinamidine synthase subunit PurQ [Myxococcales bacterium]